MKLRALIADDEPALRLALKRELLAHMPNIDVVSEVGDGIEALNWLRENPVDLCFLDIRMPGLTGLEVANILLDDHLANSGDQLNSQDNSSAPPLVIFVTAYDEYAVEAFDAGAIDYLLKPVTEQRIKQTLNRIVERIDQRESREQQEELERKLRDTLSKLSRLSEANNSLRAIRASVGDQIRMIPVGDIVLLHAEDKYITVYTVNQQALIRETIKDLLPRLPSDIFVQIHRSSIVNLTHVEAANRLAPGKLTLTLRGLNMTPTVSRPFQRLFKAM